MCLILYGKDHTDFLANPISLYRAAGDQRVQGQTPSGVTEVSLRPSVDIPTLSHPLIFFYCHISCFLSFQHQNTSVQGSETSLLQEAHRK